MEAVRRHSPDVVGYSGLLTTTLGGMSDQMEALKKAGLRDRMITIVGGAPVTRDFAERNGVDLFGKDANEGVLVIEEALAARCAIGLEKQQSNMGAGFLGAHTSPVYVPVEDKGIFIPTDALYMMTLRLSARGSASRGTEK